MNISIPYKAILLCAVAFPVLLFAQKNKGGAKNGNINNHRNAESLFLEGEKYFMLEDYAKAMAFYEKAISATPDNATLFFRMADVLKRNGQQEELARASQYMENALRLEKKNPYFYLLAANIYAGMTQYGHAASTVEALIREVKGSEEQLFELGTLYQYAEKPEEAIKAYNRAEDVFGVNETSSIQKIRLYLDAGKEKQAFQEGEKLMAAFPGEERYLMAYTEMLSQHNMREEAIGHLEKHIQQYPESYNAKMLLAGFYRDAQQEGKARELLMEIFGQPSVDFSSKVIVMGSYNHELNQDRLKDKRDVEKEAFVQKLFESLVLQYPDQPNIHVIGGDLFLSSGKNTEAIASYKKAIALGESSFEVWQNLLFLEVQLNRFDEAIRDADKALELFPTQGNLHYFQGVALFRKKMYSEAIDALLQAKNLTNSQPIINDINGMLGDAYHANQQDELSDKAFDEALAANPDNPIILNNYSYYLALRKTKLDKAEKMGSQLIKAYPNDPAFLDTYAWVLYAQGKYKEARKVMERALQSGKVSATHYEHYGDILFRLGEQENAVEQWKKAQALDSGNEVLNKKIQNKKIYGQ